MGWKVNSPGCPCCCNVTCQYFVDDFPLTQDPVLPSTVYDEVVGTWIRRTNGLIPPTNLASIRTTSANTLVLYRGAGGPAQTVFPTIAFEGSSAIARAILNYLDEDNYAYAKFGYVSFYEVSCELFKVVSGSHTSVAGPMTFYTQGYVSYCDNYLQAASGYPGTYPDQFLSGNVGDSGGTLAGFGTGSTGGIWLDDFSWYGCVAGALNQGKARLAYTLTIDGTDYRLLKSGAPSAAEWYYSPGGDGNETYVLTITYNAGTKTTTVLATYTNYTESTSRQWRRYYTTCPDGLFSDDTELAGVSPESTTCYLSQVT